MIVLGQVFYGCDIHFPKERRLCICSCMHFLYVEESIIIWLPKAFFADWHKSHYILKDVPFFNNMSLTELLLTQFLTTEELMKKQGDDHLPNRSIFERAQWEMMHFFLSVKVENWYRFDGSLSVEMKLDCSIFHSSVFVVSWKWWQCIQKTIG